jgi:hypothetical protein
MPLSTLPLQVVPAPVIVFEPDVDAAVPVL